MSFFSFRSVKLYPSGNRLMTNQRTNRSRLKSKSNALSGVTIFPHSIFHKHVFLPIWALFLGLVDALVGQPVYVVFLNRSKLVIMILLLININSWDALFKKSSSTHRKIMRNHASDASTCMICAVGTYLFRDPTGCSWKLIG